MIKRNSIFIRVFVPVIIVMLLQVLLISIVLNANGTLRTLDKSAADNLQKNAENRGIALENHMVHYLANLDKLQSDVELTFSRYLTEENLSPETVLGSKEHLGNILFNLSNSLLSALRLSTSTGVYLYFIDDFAPGMLDKEEHKYEGIYYRDLDPISTPSNYSDVQFLRGTADLARKDGIPFDSFWKESFLFRRESLDEWRDCYELFSAALNEPDFAQENLYYWNAPHSVETNSSDMSRCISYSRIAFYNGKPIAVIGTELQTDQLVKHFPSSDFDSSGRAGYILLIGDKNKPDMEYNILSATGSYIKRLLGSQSSVRLEESGSYGLLTLSSIPEESISAAFQPLVLYNQNSPFYSQQWALISVRTNDSLFVASSNLKTGLLSSSAFALIIAAILLGFIIRISTNPLFLVVEQIQKGDPSDPIVAPKTNTYETDLLCSTINTMKAKRRDAEAALREERERYLIALENVADTFMEYDALQNSFILYFFKTENQKPILHSHVTQNFLQMLAEGALCHPNDSKKMARFFEGFTDEPVELRIKRGLFSHIRNTAPDGEYYWFAFKASAIYDDSGALIKIIGLARDITGEKLLEQARAESLRRDVTTGLYNLDYGLIRIREGIRRGGDFALCALHIDSFDLFEAHYGRTFSSVVLMNLSAEILALLSGEDIALRASNDVFLILFSQTGKAKLSRFTGTLAQKIEHLYTGENTELRLGANFGAALPGDGEEPDALIGKAFAAMQAAKGGIVYAADCDETAELGSIRKKAVSISLDVRKDTINSVTFDLFERTPDIPSVINILLRLLGRLYALNQIIVCAYDPDFNTAQVIYQWGRTFVKPYSEIIEKVSQEDFSEFEKIINENGTILYNTQDALRFSGGVQRLLCVRNDERASVFGCAMYENGEYAGTILFKAREANARWDDEDMRTLNEITKAISAHISIQKSTSASHAKSDFLSRMSHEIRTPMNAIIGMTEIAKESTGDTQRLDNCLRTIELSSKHLLTIINDILDMSRIESGKLKIENEVFSFDELLDSVECLMRPQMEKKGILFSVNKKLVHSIVSGDEYRLRQVLVNLLGNACKFTGEGGAVTLSLREHEHPEGPVYRFSVKDTGIGISKEDQPRLFNAFEQAKVPAGTLRQQGTGLGLSISGSLVSAMGGKIELISELGRGSEFFFTLHFEQSELPFIRGVSSEGVETGGFAGKRVLLAEDNDINMEIATYILQTEAELVVDTARNGQEAVDMFAASEPGYYDLILMDIQMPLMDGLTATRQIRKNTKRPDAKTVPIIAMTANAFDEDMKKSIESGMNGHLIKPIEKDKLFSMLSALFQK